MEWEWKEVQEENIYTYVSWLIHVNVHTETNKTLYTNYPLNENKINKSGQGAVLGSVFFTRKLLIWSWIAQDFKYHPYTNNSQFIFFDTEFHT